MLFLCVLSIFPTKGTRHCGFPLPFQLWLLRPNSGHGDSSAEKNLHWSVLKPLLRSPDPHPGQTLTPDISSNQTDPHPGQMPTLNRRSPQTDPQSRQTLTPDRSSPWTDPHPGQTPTLDRPLPQTDTHPRETLKADRPSPWTDPHPRQMLTPDPHPSCSKSRHHGDRAPPADSSLWWLGQEGLWAESPSPKSSFCEIRFCPSVHRSQMSTASSRRS